MQEMWKPVVGYENLYEVSNLGNVRNVNKKWTKKPRLLKQHIHNEYMIVVLYKDSKAKNKRVHRLVAEAFIPNSNNYQYINHKDENPKNNVVDNLEWCTMTYNNTYGHRLEKICKKINQYDLQGNFIKTWNSFMEIQRELGFSNSSIVCCCKGRVKKSNGYIWKYAEEGKSNE